MTAPITAADLAEAEEDRAKARKYFQWWFRASLVTTLALNGLHPWMDTVAPRIFATVVFCLPPVVAFAAGYGVERLWQCRNAPHAGAASGRGTSTAIWVAVAATAALLVLAGVLSYASLAEMAACGPRALDRCTAGNLSGGLARFWPLSIDTGLVVTSVALYALRPMSGADRRALRRPTQTAATTSPQLSQPAAAAAAVAAPVTPQPAAAPAAAAAVPSPAKPAAAAAPKPQPAPVVVTDAHRDRAAALIDGGVTKPLETVADVLARLDAGHKPDRIYRETSIHHATVKAWRDAAAQPHLTAV